jgi:hypothetical protein
MSLYAADHGAPFLHWTNFSNQSFNCLNHAITPFRQNADKVDQVLTTFAFDLYKTAMKVSLDSEDRDTT